jgi:polysaccharide pyruvyl transferase WcaK-like protein
MSLKSITLLGSSSGRNAGDAALMSGIMEAIDEETCRKLNYEIPTINTRFVSQNYPNCNTLPIPMMPWNMSIKVFGVPTYRSIMRSDLSLVFDAVLFDRALYNPLFNFLSTFSLFFPHAKKKGKLLGYYNVGIGPVNTQRGKNMLRDLTDMVDFAAVRDQDSYDILQDIGTTNPRIFICADAALNVHASEEAVAESILKELGFEANEEILAINVNTYIDTWAGPHIKPMSRDKFTSDYATAITEVYKKLKVPILFVSTQHSDVSITKEVISKLPKLGKVALLTNVDHSHYDVKAVLSKVSLVFAMRLHCMILASSEMTPIVGLAYQPKNYHYFNSIHLPEYCIGFEDFSATKLIDHILKGWSDREFIKTTLKERIPIQQEKARIPAKLISFLDSGMDIDTAFSKLNL